MLQLAQEVVPHASEVPQVPQVTKVPGETHPPDMATKHLPWKKMVDLMRRLDIVILSALGANLLQGATAEPTAVVAGGALAVGPEGLQGIVECLCIRPSLLQVL